MAEWYESYGVVSDSASPPVKQKSKMSWSEYSKGLARQIEQGLSFGFADEIEGFLSEKLLGQKDATEGIRKEMSQFRSEFPKTALAAELGGSMLTPTGRQNLLRRQMAKGAAGGALYGAGVAEGDIQERLPSAIAGGLFGSVLPTVGRGTSEGAKRLLKMGLPLTAGQAGTGLFGGTIRAVEDVVSTIPVAGTAIKEARMDTLRKFGTATFNEALDPIVRLGAKPVPLTKTPRQASIHADKEIRKAYKSVFAKLDSVPTLDDAISAIDSVSMTALDKLGEKGWKQTRDTLVGIVSRRSKDGKFDASNFINAHGVIRDTAIQKKKSTEDLAKAQGEIYSEIQDALFERLIAKNLDVAPDIKSLGSSYRMYTTLDELVRKKDIEEAGTFLPSQLLSAVRRDPYASAKQMRELDVPLQKTARAAQDILPSQLPSSGTAERTLIQRALPFAGAGAGAGLAYYDPQAAMYTAGGLTGMGGANLLMYNPYFRPLTRAMASEAGRVASTPAAGGLLGQQFVE